MVLKLHNGMSPWPRDRQSLASCNRPPLALPNAMPSYVRSLTDVRSSPHICCAK